jgi:hypothetical protein
LDQENMLERNCKPAGYEVTTLIEAVEASDNSISGMLLATGEFVMRLSKSYGIISIA